MEAMKLTLYIQMRTIFANGVIASRAPLEGVSYILCIVFFILIWRSATESRKTAIAFWRRNRVPPTLFPSQFFHLVDGVHHRPRPTPFFHHFVHLV
jgi:hypothetical protein